MVFDVQKNNAIEQFLFAEDDRGTMYFPSKRM